jgi:hypothetical protein
MYNFILNQEAEPSHCGVHLYKIANFFNSLITLLIVMGEQFIYKILIIQTQVIQFL